MVPPGALQYRYDGRAQPVPGGAARAHGYSGPPGEGRYGVSAITLVVREHLGGLTQEVAGQIEHVRGPGCVRTRQVMPAQVMQQAGHAMFVAARVVRVEAVIPLEVGGEHLPQCSLG